jgi:hypothetical protein
MYLCCTTLARPTDTRPPTKMADLKAKETKKCLHRDVDDDDLVEFCQL